MFESKNKTVNQLTRYAPTGEIGIDPQETNNRGKRKNTTSPQVKNHINIKKSRNSEDFTKFDDKQQLSVKNREQLNKDNEGMVCFTLKNTFGEEYNLAISSTEDCIEDRSENSISTKNHKLENNLEHNIINELEPNLNVEKNKVRLKSSIHSADFGEKGSDEEIVKVPSNADVVCSSCQLRMVTYVPHMCYFKGPMLCWLCLHSYYDVTSFNKHTEKCWKKDDSHSNSCEKCNLQIYNEKSYKSHVKNCNNKKYTLADLLSDKDHSYSTLPLSSIRIDGRLSKKTMKDKFIKCDDCLTLYLSKTAFMGHKKNDVCDTHKKRVQCTYKDCPLKFTRYEHLLQHLPVYHNDTSYQSKCKVFSDFETFLQWKNEEQNERYVYLVKTRGAMRYKSSEYHYYECQFNSVTEGKRGGPRKTAKRRSSGVVPHLFCPARMTVGRNMDNGKVIVNYIETHSHKIQLEHTQFQRFPKSIIENIYSELKKGATPKEIYDFYHKDDSDKANLKMTNLISLRFIKNLKYKLDRMERTNQSQEVKEDVQEECTFIEEFEEDGSNEFVLVPIMFDGGCETIEEELLPVVNYKQTQEQEDTIVDEIVPSDMVKESSVTKQEFDNDIPEESPLEIYHEINMPCTIQDEGAIYCKSSDEDPLSFDELIVPDSVLV